ncbi:TIGR00266 family protein [Eggerthia catenaformis OT 569 = DSM 20559]|uniref:TIGR00266 family protein n=1 Tax=Eggerthia catenaformis OT 569 = DSM 20559 TaxID=999415 RepID=M2NEM4_9FIRM|nr:TIGR00266 family protein [Eggerthia catenaformis]EMD16663.1 TIGR00266 family protein [Eggerthia catenaformis OT 569 = DSM 20559]OUC51258.1 TIGR00266 family protein [Eggerthia catenaformis]
MKYEIKGSPFPAVLLNLNQGESMLSDSGAMAWMTPGIQMETTSNGGVGKALGRAFSGETLFINKYTAMADGQIAFSSSFPGEIRAVQLQPGQGIVLQKSAFLASTTGVSREVFFSRKFSTGLFGGEGFIMSRYIGPGLLFLEIDGTAVEYDLAAGQQMIIDSGYLAAMSDTCKMDIQRIKGMKNIFLGGEGLFNTVVTGPGHIIIQTMPISSLAGTIGRYIPGGK